MLTYLVRRLLLFPITLVGLSVLVFSFSIFLSPVERLMTFIQSPLEIKGGQEMIDRMLEKYGLNDPIYT